MWAYSEDLIGDDIRPKDILPDNILPINSADTNVSVTHNLIEKELDKRFANGKFILANYEEDGSIRFYHGDKLSIGDVAYLQKLIDFKCDQRIKNGMFQ